MNACMRRTWILPLLLAGALAPGLRRPPATPAIIASAPLGALTTAQVDIDNLGQPATTAQLYEALKTPQTAAGAPGGGPLRVPLPATSGPITADLLAAFSATANGQSDMIVYLAEQADLSADAAIPDWNARGAAVVSTLQQRAAATQAPLLELLRRAGYAPRSFWIVNAAEVKGDRALADIGSPVSRAWP
jgi:hypothetical protein